ncbi:hypothetical protein DSO57_1034954 [Entomophthora muscae]|uniref:Uncharacterized protein n=1 Tax=Entomophthora muscae TaxID=34485 RepID=A0ACC2RQM5_9FUNG|nr:hypothetical protein DSO57_1034954 [Entomophthora muscae]
MHLLCTAVGDVPAGQKIELVQHKCLLRNETREGRIFAIVQGARVLSINPQVPKLTQKLTKVTTTKKVINKEVELTSYVFEPVYFQEKVLAFIMEKVKPVIDTSYKPHISDSNQEDNDKPKFYRTTEGQLVLKKAAVFYNKVPMPCVPVPEQDTSSTKPTKAIRNVRFSPIECKIIYYTM